MRVYGLYCFKAIANAPTGQVAGQVLAESLLEPRPLPFSKPRPLRMRIRMTFVMPATNAMSERSFSALRRVKNYLQSTMLQERLNYLMVLHVHSDRTDKLDLKFTVNDFVRDSLRRSNIFFKVLTTKKSSCHFFLAACCTS